MAQHDMNIANQSFPATRTDINNALAAIVSTHSGTSAPSTTFANQIWYDSSANIIYIRNEDNDANIPLLQLDQSSDVAATLATIIDVLDASGTNQSGTALTLRGGASTGSASGGSIVLQTTAAGSSGSSVNSHATRLSVSDAGAVALPTDSAKISFGADGDISLTHDPDSGLLLKNTNTSDGNPARITLQTGETAVETGDNLGQINFQAPDEASGTDAIVTGATIAAVAEADFAADANATSLRFLTGASGAATSKMAIRSDGNVGIGTNSPSLSSGIGLEIEDAGTCGIRLQRTGSTASVLEIRADDGTSVLDARASEPLEFQINGVYKARFDTSGNFRIGTTDGSPASSNVEGILLSGSTGSIHASRSNNVALLVNRGNSGSIQQFRRAGTTIASISITSTAVTYGTGSDYRLKENVTGLTDGITRLKKLDPKRFNFIVEPDTLCDGFIAHEVAEVVPEAIAGEKDATEPIGDVKDADGKTLQTGVVKPDDFDEEGHTWTATGTQPVYQNIDQAKLVPVLTAALQEAIAKIETLETKVAALEG